MEHLYENECNRLGWNLKTHQFYFPEQTVKFPAHPLEICIPDLITLIS